jgi:hypothetical protein
MSHQTQNQDFQPLTQYDQSLVKNESWVNVTVTKTDSDGSKSQVSTILPTIPRRRNR